MVEVSARFVLDAPPGRQAAIDADLRAVCSEPSKHKKPVSDSIKKPSCLARSTVSCDRFARRCAAGGAAVAWSVCRRDGAAFDGKCICHWRRSDQSGHADADGGSVYPNAGAARHDGGGVLLLRGTASPSDSSEGITASAL